MIKTTFTFTDNENPDILLTQFHGIDFNQASQILNCLNQYKDRFYIYCGNQLDDNHLFQYNYCVDSRLTVFYDPELPIVSIEIGDDEHYFMQGEQCDEWENNYGYLVSIYPMVDFEVLKIIASYNYCDLGS